MLAILVDRKLQAYETMSKYFSLTKPDNEVDQLSIAKIRQDNPRVVKFVTMRIKSIIYI